MQKTILILSDKIIWNFYNLGMENLHAIQNTDVVNLFVCSLLSSLQVTVSIPLFTDTYVCDFLISDIFVDI